MVSAVSGRAGRQIKRILEAIAHVLHIGVSQQQFLDALGELGCELKVGVLLKNKGYLCLSWIRSKADYRKNAKYRLHFFWK